MLAALTHRVKGDLVTASGDVPALFPSLLNATLAEDLGCLITATQGGKPGSSLGFAAGVE
jgi:hypothetical protein